MKKFLYILAAAICVCSCVYPFDDFADTEVDGVVIEGDIVVGGISYFLPSRLQKLDDIQTYSMISADVWVESEDGRKYNGKFKDSTYGYSVNLEGADATMEYRLRVDTPDGKHYASQWGKAEGKVVIDGLKYQKDTVAGKLNLQLGLHSDGSSRHFRYRYTEDWEYHAWVFAYVYYDVEKNSIEWYENGQNTYYCWRNEMSRGLNLATTEKMSEDRLTDFTFKTIDKTEERLSVLYRIKLDVYPVSPESYAYYENVRDVSSPTGDLFSPMPSEVRGNIRNMEDDTEMVYGHVAVVQPSTATLYYDNELERFYVRTGRVEYEEVAVTSDKFKSFYLRGYLPARSDPFEGDMWGQARCIDCRKLGGTKNKPEGWPNGSL